MKAIAEDLGISYWFLVHWQKEYEEFEESAFAGKNPVGGERVIMLFLVQKHVLVLAWVRDEAILTLLVDESA